MEMLFKMFDALILHTATLKVCPPLPPLPFPRKLSSSRTREVKIRLVYLLFEIVFFRLTESGTRRGEVNH